MALFSYRNRYPEVSTSRIEEFSDGVFSIVITLLVLNISVPVLYGEAVYQLSGHLWALWPKVLGYVLSFILIGIYWVAHHNVFLNIRRSDRVLLWLNNLFLMCVTFLPFPTALIGQYGDQPVAVMIYGIMIIITNMWLAGLWWYASHRNRLVDPHMNPLFRGFILRRIAVAPVLSIIGIALSLYEPKMTLVVYGLTALLHFIPNPLFARELFMAQACDPESTSTQESSSAAAPRGLQPVVDLGLGR